MAALTGLDGLVEPHATYLFPCPEISCQAARFAYGPIPSGLHCLFEPLRPCAFLGIYLFFIAFLSVITSRGTLPCPVIRIFPALCKRENADGSELCRGLLSCIPQLPDYVPRQCRFGDLTGPENGPAIVLTNTFFLSENNDDVGNWYAGKTNSYRKFQEFFRD